MATVAHGKHCQPRTDAEHGEYGDADGRRCERAQGHDDEPPRLQRRAREAADGLHDDCNHDRLDAIEHAGRCRQRAKPPIGPRDGHHEQERRQDEAGPGQNESPPPGAAKPDEDRELCRARARDQARRAEQVEKLLARQPLSSPDDVLLHHRDVTGRAAERDGPEGKEEAREIAEGCRRGAGKPCHGLRCPCASAVKYCEGVVPSAFRNIDVNALGVP